MSDSFETPWTATWQAPLSMWFSRQEYWSGLLFPSPGYLPDTCLLHCRWILYHWATREAQNCLLLLFKWFPYKRNVLLWLLIIIIHNCPLLLNSSILDTFQPGGEGKHLPMSCHFAFSYCPWGSCGKNTGVVWHSLL